MLLVDAEYGWFKGAARYFKQQASNRRIEEHILQKSLLLENLTSVSNVSAHCSAIHIAHSATLQNACKPQCSSYLHIHT